jgi:leucyl-tRNA synthetase
MRRTGHLDLDEPFAGLFTQGMVTHETYKDANGRWLFPDEVDLSVTPPVHKKTGEPVTIGSIESMSKSKRNTVGPEEITSLYGADTARWFVLSDSPPERDVQWTAAGVEGAHRHVQRVWRLTSRLAAEMPPPCQPRPAMFGEEALDLRRHVHRTIDAVTNDLEKLRFNRAVAQLYELTNVLTAAADRQGAPDLGWALREGCEALVMMFAPMMPHLAEECWRILGNEGMVAEAAWPEVEPHLLQVDSVTMPVQINGKKRAEMTLPIDSSQSAVEKAVLELDVVERFLNGRAPKKIVIVPNRIVNVVV